LTVPEITCKYVVEGLPIEQAVCPVFTGETGQQMFFMLEDALLRAARDPDVQGSRQAAHDVDAITFSVAQVKASR
jgi:hypothetical protein